MYPPTLAATLLAFLTLLQCESSDLASDGSVPFDAATSIDAHPGETGVLNENRADTGMPVDGGADAGRTDGGLLGSDARVREDGGRPSCTPDEHLCPAGCCAAEDPAQILLPPEGSASFGVQLDLASGGGTLVVGDHLCMGNGCVRIYEVGEDGLYSSDPVQTLLPPAGESWFGRSVAINFGGEFIAVGSYGEPVPGRARTGRGAVRIYERSEGGLYAAEPVATLEGPDGRRDFGESIDVNKGGYILMVRHLDVDFASGPIVSFYALDEHEIGVESTTPYFEMTDEHMFFGSGLASSIDSSFIALGPSQTEAEAAPTTYFITVYGRDDEGSFSVPFQTNLTSTSIRYGWAMALSESAWHLAVADQDATPARINLYTRESAEEQFGTDPIEILSPDGASGSFGTAVAISLIQDRLVVGDGWSRGGAIHVYPLGELLTP